MIKKLCICIFFTLLTLSQVNNIYAVEIKSYLVTESFEEVVPSDIKTYFHQTIPLNYQSGKVYLSLNPDGTGEALVGEQIQVTVNGDNTFQVMTNNIDCSKKKMPPLDITHLMDKGANGVTVTYRKECYNFEPKVHDNLYLVHFDDYEPTTEPFLDLPWDYRSKNMTFEDAATKMTSYFDHEYPILSADWFLSEPSEVNFNIIRYDGKKTEDPYSRHDGYDYAAINKLFLNDPVLAAANGIATYVNSCKSCGNTIHIDHGNGYQTRYYHLQPDNLVINNPNNNVQVLSGQQIGKVGFSGSVDPAGEGGAHLHFMIIQDKNGDGNFDDNIPDGIVDPYGWQGNEPDPWERFLFTQNGVEKTGAKSRYLWKSSLSGIKKSLSPEGGIFTSNRFTFNFPKNATSKYLVLSLKPTPFSESSAELIPIGYIIDATAGDGFGNLVTQFSKLFTISMKILLTDYSRYKPESLSIYSSPDGTTWQKETTILDLSNRTASTQVNHLTQFAFMGEKKDSAAPETNMLINNNQIGTFEAIYYDPVTISFEATDEPLADSLGIDHTFVKINENEWSIYEEPVIIAEVGEHTIQYYSIDKDGNTEDIKTTQLEIQAKPTPTSTPNPTYPTPTLTLTPTSTVTPTPTTDESNNINKDNRKRINKQIFKFFEGYKKFISKHLYNKNKRSSYNRWKHIFKWLYK